jgi:MFS family permease
VTEAREPSETASTRAERLARGGRAGIPGTVVALGIVSLLNDLGGHAVTPLLPAFVATVGGGPEALGLIEGVADATASLVQLASGYLADRTGKLKALAFAGYGWQIACALYNRRCYRTCGHPVTQPLVPFYRFVRSA